MTSANQRMVVNLGSTAQFLYPYINHLKNADGFLGPVSTSFTATPLPWPAYIDEDGWPNTTLPSGSFGGGFRIPDPSKFSGTYVWTWDGAGEVLMGGTGLTWTETNANTTWTRVSNGRWQTKNGQTSMRVEMTISGSGPQLISFQILSSNLNGGGHVRNMKFFRLEDEADLLAGKVFRSAFKEWLAAFNPSAVRFMDWHGGNNSWHSRFENRTLPSYTGYNGASDFVSSPVYTDKATFTDAPLTNNQYVISAASPTSANPKTTPASMVHGEVATVLFQTAMVRSTAKVVSGISKANPGVVTCTGHGRNTGDIVAHVMSQTASQYVGMVELNFRPVRITVLDANSYSIQDLDTGADIDTTGFTTFNAGTAPSVVGSWAYPTLQVGGGNDRVAYPILTQDGQLSRNIVANTYYTFVFDKSIAFKKDSSGNLIYGAWLQIALQGGGYTKECPLEIMTALVNELNEISEQPIHMWLNIPHMALTTLDSDYSAESDWAKNAVDVVLNGANGYAGLTPAADLYVEYSNETWNFGGSGFLQTFYLCRRGQLRWGGSTTDSASMSSFRSTCVMRDIAAAFPGNTRVKRILGCQGSQGISGNNLRINGSTNYLTDSDVVANGIGTPISNHDGICHATYFDAGDVYYSGSGTGSFTDDSAMYAGTSPYSSPDQSQAIANFVAQLVGSSGLHAQPLNQFTNPANPTAGLDYGYANAMDALGKISIQYEGAPDCYTIAGASLWGGHVTTSADAAFIKAALNSKDLGDAYWNYLKARSEIAGAQMTSLYLIVGFLSGDRRWAFVAPDTYGTGNTEGGGMDQSDMWQQMRLHNNSKRRFTLRT